ncbi:hypothetical protein MW887_007867 [Aspergillus wentii]|nr:hypothetical protein MW887_007867 [Aspergillus wentii]
MPETELWSTLVTAIDPENVKAMPAVLQSTIHLLESELVKARAALQEIQPNVNSMCMQRDDLAVGAMAAYRQHLIGRAPGFYYGTRRLTPKEIGLVPVVHEVQPDDDEKEDLKQEKQQSTVTVISPPRAPLEDMLSNSLILDHMAPYLSVPSLVSLAATSRFLRSMVMETPYVFRHLDLTRCRGAQISQPRQKLNSSHQTDYSSTEDEFYSAPLKGIFANLERWSILQDVRTLVLDGLSVPADLIAEIILTDRFNVNILSIKDCLHLNERKLMQVIQHAVRPTRPDGTPRVKAIYHFTPKNRPQAPVRKNFLDWWSRCTNKSRTTSTSKAASGANSESRQQNVWYDPSGKIFKHTIEEGWAQTIQKCEGIIAFDAVLCRGPRHNVSLFSSENQDGPQPEGQLLGPALATIALGSKGCECCHSSPEGPAIWGQSPSKEFPLLAPLPLHSSTVAAAQHPDTSTDGNPILIARCTDFATDLSPHQTAIRGPLSNQGAGPSSPQQQRIAGNVDQLVLPARWSVSELVKAVEEFIASSTMTVALRGCVTGAMPLRALE